MISALIQSQLTPQTKSLVTYISHSDLLYALMYSKTPPLIQSVVRFENKLVLFLSSDLLLFGTALISVFLSDLLC